MVSVTHLVICLGLTAVCAVGEAGAQSRPARSPLISSLAEAERRPTAGLKVVAVVNVSIIPMDSERVLPHQTVLVRAGRIVALGTASRVLVPRGALRIDGRGKYVLPGLADMHVHFVDQPTSPQTLGPQIDRALAALNVAAGVTSALSLCGFVRDLAFRDSIAQGAILGPRLAVSDRCINDSTMSRAGGDSLARRDYAAGYDFLKVYSFLSREGFDGLADAARQVGMPIIGHIPVHVGLAGMLNARVADIAHVEELMYNAPFRLDYGSAADDAVELDPSAIPAVVEALRAAGTYVTTTLVAYQAILDEAVDLDKYSPAPALTTCHPRRVSSSDGTASTMIACAA
jgi:imidazolonepropionase-like amidohydrolase